MNETELDRQSFHALRKIGADADPFFPYSLQLVIAVLEKWPSTLPSPADEYYWQLKDFAYLILYWNEEQVHGALDDEMNLADQNLSSDELGVRMAENLFWTMERLGIVILPSTWD